MVRVHILPSILFCWAAVAAALPAVVEVPSRTVQARDAAPDWVSDNVVAAANVHGGSSEGSGFGSKASQDNTCDLSSVKLPQVPDAAPLPAPNGTLAYVAVGRGTQNYTCDPSKPSETPTPIGAVASLYDASCMAGGALSFLLPVMPTIALQFPQPATSDTDSFIAMTLLGHHYFTNPKSPTFNLDTTHGNAGYVNVAAGTKIKAPSTAPAGVDNKGDGAVPWLSLSQKSGQQGDDGQQTFQSVFRVYTAGGSPPSDCTNQPESFEVPYAAEYFFYK